MKKLCLFFITCFTFVSFAKEKKSSFLISPSDSVNRASKNELKENIGEELKQALYACASITNELGNVQRELAELQRRILSRVENLVENKRCFKKAKRNELSRAFDIMAGIKNQLKTQKENIKKMSLQMNKNRCLKEDIKT